MRRGRQCGGLIGGERLVEDVAREGIARVDRDQARRRILRYFLPDLNLTDRRVARRGNREHQGVVERVIRT